MPPKNDPERITRLQNAFSDSFDMLLTVMEGQGFTPIEAADAALQLAVARVLALNFDVDTQETIRRAVASMHGIN